MINLDDKQKIIQLQKGEEVIVSINNLPQQLYQSFTEAQKINFPASYSKATHLVVCGMGGSRFPALTVFHLFKEKLKIPCLINDDYQLPGFVDKNTLVILSSYSGTTEEVIVCGKKAKKQKAKITGITSGGEISSFLKKIKAPGYVFNPRYNPSKQPRVGFGYNVGALLGILTKLKIINLPSKKILQAIKNLEGLLKNFSIDIPQKNNPVKQLACQIYKKYPYYVVAEFLTGVGNAIANQTNETAKSISSFRVIPELNHHLMEGLKFPERLKEMAIFIFFYSNFYSPQVQKRFKITKEVVEQNKIPTVFWPLKGKNKIEQTFELMGLGSYLTLYLSVLYQQDPTIIPYVDYFKKKLKEK